MHAEDLGALQQNVQGIRKKNEQMPTTMFHLLLKNKRLESIEHITYGPGIHSASATSQEGKMLEAVVHGPISVRIQKLIHARTHVVLEGKLNKRTTDTESKTFGLRDLIGLAICTYTNCLRIQNLPFSKS